MKLHKASLLAVPLLTVLLLTSAPLAAARNRYERRIPDRKAMPEGGNATIVALAAGVLGGALLLSRRKRNATAA